MSDDRAAEMERIRNKPMTELTSAEFDMLTAEERRWVLSALNDDQRRALAKPTR